MKFNVKWLRVLVFLPIPFLMGAEGNGCQDQSSDSIQRRQQELILAEGTAQVGMPAIINFRERKMLKDIIELRDQEGLVTYTYLVSEMTGKLGDFLCVSVGYGIPYATQFTNPMKVLRPSSYGITLPQADPNGLFSPASADGTWILCKDPSGNDVRPVFVEPRIIVSPFKLSPTAG
jgi:hypothetical protein